MEVHLLGHYLFNLLSFSLNWMFSLPYRHGAPRKKHRFRQAPHPVPITNCTSATPQYADCIVFPVSFEDVIVNLRMVSLSIVQHSFNLLWACDIFVILLTLEKSQLKTKVETLSLNNSYEKWWQVEFTNPINGIIIITYTHTVFIQVP